jgi:hypothetical protein
MERPIKHEFLFFGSSLCLSPERVEAAEGPNSTVDHTDIRGSALRRRHGRDSSGAASDSVSRIRP